MCGSVLSLEGCGVSVCDSVLKPSSGLVGPCVTLVLCPGAAVLCQRVTLC